MPEVNITSDTSKITQIILLLAVIALGGYVYLLYRKINELSSMVMSLKRDKEVGPILKTKPMSQQKPVQQSVQPVQQSVQHVQQSVQHVPPVQQPVQQPVQPDIEQPVQQSVQPVQPVQQLVQPVQPDIMQFQQSPIQGQQVAVENKSDEYDPMEKFHMEYPTASEIDAMMNEGGSEQILVQDDDGLDIMSVSELRKELVDLKLPVSGNKKKLIQRIRENSSKNDSPDITKFMTISKPQENADEQLGELYISQDPEPIQGLLNQPEMLHQPDVEQPEMLNQPAHVEQPGHVEQPERVEQQN